jgi:hypothetical protein
MILTPISFLHNRCFHILQTFGFEFKGSKHAHRFSIDATH